MSDDPEALNIRINLLEADVLEFVKSCMSMRTEGGTTEPVGGMLMVLPFPNGH